MTAPPISLPFLGGPRAHAAASRVMPPGMMVADAGDRVDASTIVFPVASRGLVEVERYLYQVRLGDGGVLYGSWLGVAPLPRSAAAASPAPAFSA